MDDDLIGQILKVLDQLVASHQRGVLDYVGTAAVVITLFVLIWYTIETYRLRVTSQKQLDVSNTPVLMLASSSAAPGEMTFPELLNLGLGPAFNITIVAEGLEEGSKLVLQHPDALGSRDRARLYLTLEYHSTTSPMFTDKDVLENMRQKRLPCICKMAIRCASATGISYRTSMSVENRDGMLFYRFGAHTRT